MTPKSWATLGLMAAAGRMPHRLADPVGHWDAQTSTADWRTALCIARCIPLDHIDPARGVGPIRPTRITGQQLALGAVP